MNITKLSKEELQSRLLTFKTVLQERELDGAVIFRPTRIQYFINFLHLSTERPIALVIPVNGEPAVLVPKLEEEHLQLQAPWITKIQVYDEYPGEKHPMLHLVALVNTLGLGDKRLGIDNDGFLDQNSYEGPGLSAIMNCQLKNVGIDIDHMRVKKTPVEVELLRQSGNWASFTHTLLQQEIQIGKSEREISRIAEEKAYLKLDEAFGKTGHFGAVGLHASFRSGTKTSMGHASMGSRLVEAGDNIVSYCQGIVSGYITELERTLFMDKPGEQKADLFKVVREAQKLALDMIKPGTECAAVDIKIRDFFEKNGKTELTTHHQGHGLGLEFHEAPFLDLGDHTVLEAGMVLSVEPGLYVRGVGGFRHSDTVLVTENGYEILTPYPSEIDELTIMP